MGRAQHVKKFHMYKGSILQTYNYTHDVQTCNDQRHARRTGDFELDCRTVPSPPTRSILFLFIPWIC